MDVGSAKLNNLHIFSGSSHLRFAEQVAAHLNVPLATPDTYPEGASHGKDAQMLHWFSNGELMVTIPFNVRDSDCFIIQSQVPPDACAALSISDLLFEAMLLAFGLKTEGGANRVFGVFPYQFYSRSDKQDKARRVIGLKWLATVLEASEFDGFLIMDAHCGGYVKLPFSRKVEVLRAKPLFLRDLFDNYCPEKCCVVAPDVGSAKSTGNIAKTFGVPIAIIDKRREGDNERVVSTYLIGDVKDKLCVIVDDETLSGRTLHEAAKFCLRKGANGVILYVTHLFLCDPDKVKELANSPAIVQFVATDTIPISPATREILGAKLKIIPTAIHFAEAIRRIHERGQSVQGYKAELYQGLPNTAEYCAVDDV